MEKSQHADFDEDTTILKALYGCESWTLRKNEETRLDAFEMKGLRKILRVSWTAKKTNEWVLNKAAVKKELLDTMSKQGSYIAYILWSHHDETRELHREDIMQRTTPGARRRERHARTACVMDKIKTWAGLLVEHQNDRGQREIEKVYVHDVANSDRGQLKNRSHAL